MAINKKKKRKITVDNNEYFWSATGNDGWINLFIMSTTPGSPRLNCYFDYHHDEEEVAEGHTSLSNQFVITPYIVRQVIEYAFKIGWKPNEKGKDMNLRHIDDKIDLRLHINKENKIKGL